MRWSHVAALCDCSGVSTPDGGGAAADGSGLLLEWKSKVSADGQPHLFISAHWFPKGCLHSSPGSSLQDVQASLRELEHAAPGRRQSAGVNILPGCLKEGPEGVCVRQCEMGYPSQCHVLHGCLRLQTRHVEI